jgi:hypothetical protein
MLQKEFSLSTEQIGKATSHFTIGFGRLRVETGVEHITSAGSGTLVTIGSVHGILTAAHVIEALPKKGNVGIITSVDDSLRLEAFKMEMDHAAPVVVGEQRSIELGPDLAFLRLPLESVGWLTAKNSFYNLRKYRDDVLANKAPEPDHVDTMTGVIDELTAESPGSKPGAKKTLFTTIFCGARLAALRYVDEHGLYYFEPSDKIDFSLPGSFEGMSGGAAWRFYVTKNKDGTLNPIDRRLIAVPFYQSSPSGGRREITCQGPMGIYGSLIDAVAKRWPDEASKT